jgi:hypothetical protein
MKIDNNSNNENDNLILEQSTINSIQFNQGDSTNNNNNNNNNNNLINLNQKNKQLKVSPFKMKVKSSTSPNTTSSGGMSCLSNDNNTNTNNNNNNNNIHQNLQALLANTNCQFMPKCPLCDKIFANSSNLKHHMSTIHFNEAKWICNECGKVNASSIQVKLIIIF